MAKSFIEELTGYRVKVQKDGKEVLNVPGILAFLSASRYRRTERKS